MELSSLSNVEFVRLVANYNDLWQGEKNKVSSQANTRGYTPEQLAQATSRIAEKFNPVESCGLRFMKPYGELKYESLNFVLPLFENYERGCLPFPGAVTEQPAQIMEIFSVLRQLKHEVEISNQGTKK